MAASVRSVSVVHVGPAGAERRQDAVAVEEPLAIRVDGRLLLTTMRTPGGERDLAVGLLLSERVIQTPDDIATVRVCEDASAGNVVDVTLLEPAASRARAASHRSVTQTSACGVCGRQSIDDLRVGLPALDRGFRVSASVIASCPTRSRRRTAPPASPVSPPAGSWSMTRSTTSSRHGSLTRCASG